MNEQRKRPEKKGKEQRKPLSRVRKSMRTSMASAVLASGIMGVSSREKLDLKYEGQDTSVPQKLVENNALVKTDERVTDEDVSNLLEKEDSRGKFELIRDSEHGNPKVVATTQTENGYKVEFVLEVTSEKYEKKVSEILGELGVVSEDLIGRVELIEMAFQVSIAANKPELVEDTIMLMLDERPRLEESELKHGVEYNIKLKPGLSTDERAYNAVNSTYLEKILRDPTFMSDPADWLNDGSF